MIYQALIRRCLHMTECKVTLAYISENYRSFLNGSIQARRERERLYCVKFVNTLRLVSETTINEMRLVCVFYDISVRRACNKRGVPVDFTADYFFTSTPNTFIKVFVNTGIRRKNLTPTCFPPKGLSELSTKGHFSTVNLLCK